jgi:hypothetical protein
MCHVDIIRKPFRWVNGQTVAVDTVAEECELIAIALPGWRPEMPGVVPPFSPVIRMGGMIGRKRKLISRHGLSKSQESAVAHSERGKQDEGHDTQPDPPSTAHHSSMHLIFKAFGVCNVYLGLSKSTQFLFPGSDKMIVVLKPIAMLPGEPYTQNV